MLKIGIGPSSSHTLGPWRAAEMWLEFLHENNQFDTIDRVEVNLYGSLSLTGKGHATDFAVILGLLGEDPEQIPVENIQRVVHEVQTSGTLNLGGRRSIDFKETDIQFQSEFLKFHANGMKFSGFSQGALIDESVYFSIGGGFVVQEKDDHQAIEYQNEAKYPFPIHTAKELSDYCVTEDRRISEVVFINEQVLRSTEEIENELQRIWDTMLECMYVGCHTEGILPGGLNVKRRAFGTHQQLIGDRSYSNPKEWLEAIRQTEVKFRQILKWVSCFALAVNEVNGSLGRVVTAPTNGSAGVIPAVLMYYLTIEDLKAGTEEINRFLLVAGELGSIFKKGSTISAAMGGCQAEIGVSSAMAAGALTELLGGTPEQVLIAAEIAMEHHLGLTCDPIGGLVQIPCIERNSMGAIKAIHAAELALDTDPAHTKVPLDKVIETMRETAKDMHSNYKETSQGGLAIKVSLADC